jgi:hypothetical protein
MNETQVLELPQWNLTPERLPKRSMLYAPTPVGMGTAMGESLTSYLARLAVAHCVYPGILLREMLLPMFEEAEAQEKGSEQHPLWRRDGSGSHLLYLSRNTVENWCQGKRIPEMDMLLRLCYRLNLSLDEVLFQDAETLQPCLQDSVPEARFRPRRRTTIDKERIFHLLEQAANSTEDPPPSLQEVGQRLGYQPTTLYKINQVACHAIAECFTTYRRELREKRLQDYREEIRRIALYLQAEQVTLTQRHIARYLTQPAILRDPVVRALLRGICQEVEERL